MENINSDANLKHNESPHNQVETGEVLVQGNHILSTEDRANLETQTDRQLIQNNIELNYLNRESNVELNGEVNVNNNQIENNQSNQIPGNVNPNINQQNIIQLEQIHVEHQRKDSIQRNPSYVSELKDLGAPSPSPLRISNNSPNTGEAIVVNNNINNVNNNLHFPSYNIDYNQNLNQNLNNLDNNINNNLNYILPEVENRILPISYFYERPEYPKQCDHPIPKVSPSQAIFCLIVNIVLPGIGTMIAGCIIPENEINYTRNCCCIFWLGFLHLILTPVFVGYIFALVYGCNLIYVSNMPLKEPEFSIYVMNNPFS